MNMSIHHQSALNNRPVILEQLRSVIARTGVKSALEVASGTGAHLEVLAPAFPDITWQPTEYVPEITQETEEAAFREYGKIGQGSNGNSLELLNNVLSSFGNVQPARALSLLQPETFIAASGSGKYDLIHIGNTFHVCPRQGISGFFALANAIGSESVRLTIYGPFKRHGDFTTDSNRLFSERLMSTNPEFGLRDLESDIIPEAEKYNFRLEAIADVPSNNFFLCFSRL